MKDKIKKLWDGTKTVVKKNGVYLAFFLAFGLMGGAVAILFGMDSKMKNESNNSPKPTENMVNVNKQDDESIDDVMPTLTIKPIITQTPMPDFTEPPKTIKPEVRLLTAPVNGEIICEYAMDKLIYSSTLKQWMTHSGVDIACDIGTEVRAVAAGTIESVNNDPSMGITVVIAHTNGHVTVYSNLAEDTKLIKEGMKVDSNAVIGTCGETTVFECEQEPHIHFEYHVDNKPVNPCDYVLFGSDK